MKLSKYIKKKDKTQTAFAKRIGVNQPEVSKWVSKGYRVIRNEEGKLILYSPLRELPENELEKGNE